MKKKKKKKGMGEAIPAAIKSETKSAVSSILAYVAGAVGIMGGVFLLSKVPKSGKPLLDKVAPGILAMAIGAVLGSKVENKSVKFAAFGLGVGGAIDLLRKVVGDKVEFFNKNLPVMSGLRGLAYPGYKAVNQGDYPPSYYKDNTFQGLGNTSAYALSGARPFKGMGATTSPYALSGTSAYALSGMGNR
jgi:hypothetical protein